MRSQETCDFAKTWKAAQIRVRGIWHLCAKLFPIANSRETHSPKPTTTNTNIQRSHLPRIFRDDNLIAQILPQSWRHDHIPRPTVSLVDVSTHAPSDPICRIKTDNITHSFRIGSSVRVSWPLSMSLSSLLMSEITLLTSFFL